MEQGARSKAVAQRRRKILEAAVMCFLEEGYHQTGVRDIAARAGVSLGNLYNHFPGKHDVLIEIARMEKIDHEPFLKLLSANGDPGKVLLRFVNKYAAYASATDNVILTVEIGSEAIRKPDIAELFVANREAFVSALAALLARGVESGAFRTAVDARELAHMVLELVEGTAYRFVVEGQSMRKLLPGLRTFVLAALGAKP